MPGAGVHEGVPRIGRDDDHVAGLGVEMGAIGLEAGLLMMQDEDLGVRMPMAARPLPGTTVECITEVMSP
jgi:hypothetical protein